MPFRLALRIIYLKIDVIINEVILAELFVAYWEANIDFPGVFCGVNIPDGFIVDYWEVVDHVVDPVAVVNHPLEVFYVFLP